MDALPTVEELADWMRVGPQAIADAEKLAADAYRIRQTISGVYTSTPLGIYLHKESGALGICDEYLTATQQDNALLQNALQLLSPATLAIKEATDGNWVKTAYSPFLRRAGELLNFFPGKYPGGIPNAPSTTTAMLTSGLVGAGLGYGTGWLGEHLFPQNWRKGRLSKALGVMGGVAGAAPGMVLGLNNLHQGRGFNDLSYLSQPAGAMPQMDAGDLSGLMKDGSDLGVRYRAACSTIAAQAGEEFSALYKEAWGDTFGNAQQRPRPGALAVNIDAMGRTLWDTAASPQLAGATMGALAAAQQMPGGEEPGFVTPMQMANLAAHMGAGYVSGALVGTALGLLTGMPEETQNKLKQTGAYIGIVRAVVPRLFSQ